jgi:LysR family transcriptional regulator, low CO2-responsive transcriptional regulator
MSIKEISYNSAGQAAAQLRHLTIRQLRSLAALSAKA